MNIDILLLNNALEGYEEYIEKESFLEYCETHSFKGERNQLLSIPPSYSKNGNLTYVVGLGEVESEKNFYDLGQFIGSKIGSDAEINFLNFDSDKDLLIDGILYSQYKFNEYKSEDDSKMNEIVFKDFDISENKLKQNSIFWVRDLINTPALDKSPEAFIDKVNNLVDSSDIKVEVYDKEWLEENNFGAVLGVGKGSERPPYFLVGKYKPDAKYQVSLIGKGVLFDSGGYSLKSPSGMETMKTDMSGAASAWGVINLIARTNQNIGLSVYTPIVENMVSGAAIRPGDVLKTRNGKTIEVMNTDAEGRLIMADALAYASESKPDIICDVATLTGASYVALGVEIGAVFSNNKATLESFLNSNNDGFENYHSLPLEQSYKSLIKSNIADMKNSGGRFGGAITAALLLEEFVDDINWIHLDIAGPARSRSSSSIYPEGGTGFGVLGYLNFLINEANN